MTPAQRIRDLVAKAKASTGAELDLRTMLYSCAPEIADLIEAGEVVSDFHSTGWDAGTAEGDEANAALDRFDDALAALTAKLEAR